MTLVEKEATFTSSRTRPVAVPNLTATQKAAPEQQLKPRALILSQTPGIAEMVAQGLNKEGDIEATPLTMSLTDLVTMPDLSMTEVSVCMFEVVQGDDAQIAALRSLREMGEGRVKFLGVTSEVLTLATARNLMDAGVDEVVPLGSISPQLSHAAALAPATEDVIAARGGTLHNGMVIGVAQTRGGIGATTFALNLAAMLALKPKRSRKAKEVEAPRVAVVDLDLQNGTLGASIDVESNGALIEMLRSGSIADMTFLTKAMVSHPSGIDVLAAPVEFAPLTAMRPDMMASLLDELRMSYDYVVIDMPRTMVDWLDPVLARADKMFLLSDTSVHSVRQARRMIDFYCEDHVSLPLEVVVMLERKPFSTSSAVREAEKFLDRKFTHWVPRDDRSAKLAADRGQPLVTAKPRSIVQKAMAPMVVSLKSYFTADQRRQA
ncbi:Flp pilus assembly CpaE family ATPase [Litoreibacter ponti]|uniref:Flp pilus assembly CpaE family ATPase n=1 Tax=Litoreibacter ponti TaxID=1510457 RepID=A0A2T6BF23_9RHOB|nr:AAA family ATPase [Litoreibacter ponti]PTX54647.1 Flp pilus assembly CpaE family ATPase [Litoreibacter ponti]